jgi:hypothetical protein
MRTCCLYTMVNRSAEPEGTLIAIFRGCGLTVAKLAKPNRMGNYVVDKHK